MRTLLCILLLFCPVSKSPAQWQATNGPYLGIGSAYNLTVLGDRVWLTTSPYPYTSADSGNHWTRPDTLGNYAQFVASGNDLYAGGFSGLWRSTDNGHWTNIHPATSFYGLNALVAQNGMIFFTSGGGGSNHLERLSANNTVRTDLSTPEGVLAHVTALARKDSLLFAGSYGGPAVLVSSDNGTTWEERSFGLSTAAKVAVSSFAVKGANIYLGTAEGGVYRSSNNGVRWYSVDNGQVPRGAFVSLMGDVLFVAGGSEALRSTDGGISWSNATAGLPGESRKPLVVSGTTLYTATSDGLYYSVDSGSVWRKPMNSGTPGADIMRLGCGASGGTAGRGIVYASSVGIGLWCTTNRGSSWRDVIPGRELRRTAFLLDSTQWSLTSYGDRSLMISTDQGTSWCATGPQIPSTGTYTSLTRIDSTYLVAGEYTTRIYRWIMKDTAWQTIIAPGMGSRVAALLTHKGLVWYRAGNGALYVSSDRGETWQLSGRGITSAVISLAANGSSMYAGTEGAGVFLSTDDGATWVNRSAGLTDSNVTALHVDGQTLFAGTSHGGVFFSRDDGMRWHAFGDGLGTDEVRALASNGEDLYAAIAWNGVWVRPIADVALATGDAAGMPGHIVLEQNYPNPFNPSTTIRYGLQHRSHVMLTVFNTLGQQVAVLQDGELDAGYREARFDASNLPSGVYFYRLQAGSFTDTKKLLVVR
ncbi:MAG: T9SS type A sorting domain-containing protein [Ignavibacteriae bacterium]|nr:T9SS type A sorting domain-containing protein [Ignavibacteriota bacterium]